MERRYILQLNYNIIRVQSVLIAFKHTSHHLHSNFGVPEVTLPRRILVGRGYLDWDFESAIAYIDLTPLEILWLFYFS